MTIFFCNSLIIIICNAFKNFLLEISLYLTFSHFDTAKILIRIIVRCLMWIYTVCKKLIITCGKSWAVSSEKVPSSLCKMCRFTSSQHIWKVSWGHLFSVETFCNIQLLCSPTSGEGDIFVFGPDPIGIGVGSCMGFTLSSLRNIFWSSGWILTKFLCYIIGT